MNNSIDHLSSPHHCEGNTGGFSVRSLFIPQHNYNGVLYRTNEHVLVNYDCEPTVLRITKIFSFKVDEAYHEAYHIFVSGLKYCQVDIHSRSGNIKVKESEISVTIKGQDILRKLMLYPEEITDSFIVIDYERPSLPLCIQDILVPQYPESNDMVSVSGENEETWLAHVQSTNTSSRWCQVYFYVPDKDNTRLYRKEYHRLERVHWSSILGVVPGQWKNDHEFTIYNPIC